MFRNMLSLILLLFISQGFSESNNLSNNNLNPIILVPTTKNLEESKIKPKIAMYKESSLIITSSQIGVNSGLSNIDNLDHNAEDLMQLKRKLEIEKTQAELNKLKNNSVNQSIGDRFNQDQIQTTVTGVAIDENGRKIAWLQFADGGTLVVNIGSHVGKYIVSDITMTKVTLTYQPNSKHSKKNNIYLERIYTANLDKKSSNKGLSNMGLSPSPVITPANSENVMVPPILVR